MPQLTMKAMKLSFQATEDHNGFIQLPVNLRAVIPQRIKVKERSRKMKFHTVQKMKFSP